MARAAAIGRLTDPASNKTYDGVISLPATPSDKGCVMKVFCQSQI
jgi:uncharacterized protein (DUF2147 family)